MTSRNLRADGEVWDLFGTLHRALWSGGGQWAGKSTVARLLAAAGCSLRRHRLPP